MQKFCYTLCEKGNSKFQQHNRVYESVVVVVVVVMVVMVVTVVVVVMML
jgi:hypothetical protein